jgi:hypothetical protein
MPVFEAFLSGNRFETAKSGIKQTGQAHPARNANKALFYFTRQVK